MIKYILALSIFSSAAFAGDDLRSLRATEEAFVRIVQCAIITTVLSQIDEVPFENRIEYTFAAERFSEAGDAVGGGLLTFEKHKDANLDEMVEAIDKDLSNRVQESEEYFEKLVAGCMESYRSSVEQAQNMGQ